MFFGNRLAQSKKIKPLLDIFFGGRKSLGVTKRRRDEKKIVGGGAKDDFRVWQNT